MARINGIRIVALARLAWLPVAAMAQPVLKNNPYARIDWAHGALCSVPIPSVLTIPPLLQ